MSKDKVETSEVAVAEQPQGPVSVGFEATRENIELLKNTLAGQDMKLTDSELQLTIYQAKKTGLDPLSRQIYPMKNNGRLTFITAIDGYRLIAERTGLYRGQTEAQWCGNDGKWRDVWLDDKWPAASRVGVYKEGFTAPVYAIATWKSYAKLGTNGKKTTWDKMPDLMLAKCAEALALRKAFPQELVGVYTQEEMDQAEGNGPQESAGELLNQAAEALKALGVENKDEQKSIVLGAAGVKSVDKLSLKSIKKAIKAIADEDIEELKKKYLPQDGEVASEESDNQKD